MKTLMASEDVLYQALLDRDGRYEGRAFVCVKTTGIFCRLTCTARKPKRENCLFSESIGDCLEWGFRPCLRCQPMQPMGTPEPVVEALTRALFQDDERRWREEDVVSMGFDPSTVRRAFKRHYGISFLEMARMTRLKRGVERLTQGGKVIDAQLEAGFDSASGFRTAFAKIMGVSPSQLSSGGTLRADWISTPIGPMIAVSSSSRLQLLEFAERKGLPNELTRLMRIHQTTVGLGRFEPTEQITDELKAYYEGRSFVFKTPLELHGSAFTKSVWEELLKIPPGETRSYAGIANALGNPLAVRAVARANGSNQIAIVVPCHRVIGSDGSLTGYAGGLWRKDWLIGHERKGRMKAEG
ncbi:bifunctional transcriptional activator/DNA repair enzyme AdaA [Lacunimicrobium album]